VESEEIQLLREILHWLRFQNRPGFAALLTETLANDADRAIYELSDGSNSQGDISKAVGVAQSNVSNKWKTWRTIGIVHEVAESGRCRKLCSLGELGMIVPSKVGAKK
jgi:hypothetical protein